MDAAHEHGNLPPPPAERSISPATGAYERTATLGQLLWPLLWLAAAVALVAVVRSLGWPELPAHH